MENLFINEEGFTFIGELLLRTAIMFIAVVIVLRLSGRRGVRQQVTLHSNKIFPYCMAWPYCLPLFYYTRCSHSWLPKSIGFTIFWRERRCPSLRMGCLILRTTLIMIFPNRNFLRNYEICPSSIWGKSVKPLSNRMVRSVCCFSRMKKCATDYLCFHHLTFL